jgi:hypothetical protein
MTITFLSLLAAAAASQAAIAPAPLDAGCSNTATQATGYLPGSAQAAPAPSGARVRGAAVGAAGGALTNDVAKGAAIGVVAGGMADRQRRRQETRAEDARRTAWQNSYNACMQQKAATPPK